MPNSFIWEKFEFCKMVENGQSSVYLHWIPYRHSSHLPTLVSQWAGTRQQTASGFLGCGLQPDQVWQQKRYVSSAAFLYVNNMVTKSGMLPCGKFIGLNSSHKKTALKKKQHKSLQYCSTKTPWRKEKSKDHLEHTEISSQILLTLFRWNDSSVSGLALGDTGCVAS